MLRDHGVRRTGKEGADNVALTQAPNLCGPDQHFMQAKMRTMARDKAQRADGPYVPSDWAASEKDWRDCAKLEKRKNRGGATFSPGDCC